MKKIVMSFIGVLIIFVFAYRATFSRVAVVSQISSDKQNTYNIQGTGSAGSWRILTGKEIDGNDGTFLRGFFELKDGSGNVLEKITPESLADFIQYVRDNPTIDNPRVEFDAEGHQELINQLTEMMGWLEDEVMWDSVVTQINTVGPVGVWADTIKTIRGQEQIIIGNSQ